MGVYGSCSIISAVRDLYPGHPRNRWKQLQHSSTKWSLTAGLSLIFQIQVICKDAQILHIMQPASSSTIHFQGSGVCNSPTCAVLTRLAAMWTCGLLQYMGLQQCRDIMLYCKQLPWSKRRRACWKLRTQHCLIPKASWGSSFLHL